jgi:hypothetical protein
MMRITSPLWIGLASLAVLAAAALADDFQTAQSKSTGESNSAGEKYTLRYKFHPGETIRWEVIQRTRIRTTVSGTTQIAEMVSKSVKAWRITDVEPDGTARFEHLVESVDMRQKFSGQQEVRYNSQTDEKPAPGFETVAQSIGVPLAVITMDNKGEILKRERKPVRAAAQNEEGQITISLPDEAVPVGHTWSFPYEIEVPLEDGTVKKVKTLQKFKLASVKTGVATIEVATKILTPIHDPAIEAKVIQKEQSGTVRFDADAGRVLGQQMDLDRRVVGFTGNNPASSLHYLTRFTETLLADAPKTASRPENANEGT